MKLNLRQILLGGHWEARDVSGFCKTWGWGHGGRLAHIGFRANLLHRQERDTRDTP